MELVKKGGIHVEERTAAGKPLYRCPMDGGELDSPGPCPKCGMPLDERHLVKPEGAAKEREIWVCDVHPEQVFDAPGKCFKDT